MIYLDPRFARSDVALRRGAHISRIDYADYQFITENFDAIERFYENYGCRIAQHPEGFFFLLAKGGMLPVKTLPKSAMHLGMFIAMKARDPEITRSNSRIAIESLLKDLETSVPAATLQATYAPKQKEASSGAKVVEEVQRCLRLLNQLGFIDMDGENLTPRDAIRRFEDLARHNNAPDEMTRLALEVQRGVVFDESEPSGGEGDEDAGQDE